MNHKSIIEVLLFASPEPLTQNKLNKILFEERINLKDVVEELNISYKKQNKGLVIENIAGGYQLLSHPQYHVFIQRLLDKNKKVRLSKAGLEVLSIIAYKQPLTRVEIESIRGVDCGGVIRKLIEREMVTIKGRDCGVGRALLYGTSQKFLEGFGLNQISDLPNLKEIDKLLNNSEIPTENDIENK